MTQGLALDVVLMDIHLPKLDGIVATERIMQKRRSTIVIGLSFVVDDYSSMTMWTKR
jgi:CheY-like chemotaxis protein